jgi:hypothetical protein
MILAYIDPATGAMIIQIVAASVLAGGVFFRKIFMAPFAFLFRKNNTDTTTPASDQKN